MDREEFEQEVVGYVFDELTNERRDEVGRYLDAHADAREEERRFRATVELTRIPLDEPPQDLEERILLAGALAERHEPWHRKVLRGLAWAGSHAMRPQLAMGAILVMLLGSSLLLLRAKPGTMQVVSEKGETTAARPSNATAAAAPPEAAAEPQAAGAALRPPLPGNDAATHREQFGHTKAEAPTPVARDGAAPTTVDLDRARAVKAASGCEAALPLFAELVKKHGSEGVGAAAASESAHCEQERASSRATAELATSGSAVGGRAGASKAAKAAPKPAAPASAPRKK